jgi:type II secretory pathway pseudopilin PulG
MPKTKKTKLSKLPRGFTLIITISLMVLLTLIGIGLLSLSSVTLRASNQADSMSVARSNARMALILAINELQKSAGPDQRITARSDILGEDLVRPRLTGVWKSRNPIAAPPTTADYSPSSKKGMFLNWLVSTANSSDTTSQDFANTLGPWITTPDELEQYREGDRLDLEMVVTVNGVEYGRDSLKNMSWSFEELLAHASRGANVGAGDVLASGTAGMGAMSEHWSRSKQYDTPAPLQVGDVVEMTIAGLGSIRNTVAAGDSPNPEYRVPPARRTYSEDRL